MGGLLNVLIVEDSADDAELIVIELQSNGFELSWKRVDNKQDFEEQLEKGQWDIILSDYVMQGFTGLDAIHIFNDTKLEIPFILISGSIGEELAVEAMRLGAHDYIMKDNIMRLGPAVKRELKDAQTRREHQKAIEALKESEHTWRDTFNAISDSVSIIDPYGNILNTNQTTYTMFSLLPDEKRGININDLIPNLRFIDNLTPDSEEFSNNKSHTETIRRKDKWFNVSFDPLSDRDGNIKFVVVIKDITDERNAAEELRNSQHKLKSILISVPAGIGIVNNQRIVFVNDRLCRMLGYDEQDIIDQPVSNFFDPSQPDYQGKEFDQNQNFDFYSLETQYKCKNGNLLNVLVNTTWLDPNNKNKGITFSIQDISAIKHAETEIKESEERFKALSNATNEAIFFSKKGICIDTNKAASEMLQYNYEEFIGMLFTNIIVDESRELVRNNISRGFDEPYEVIAKRKDGTKFYAELLHKMYTYRTQKVRLTTVRDLTKRKIIETALQKSLREYRALSDNLPLGIYRATMDGKIIAYNPAFATIFGYSHNELIGKITSDKLYTHESGRQKFIELIEKNNRVKSFQTELIKKDSSVFWASINAKIMFDDNGNPEFIDGIVEDITERKKIQNELLSAKEKAEESDRLKSAFLANMSHEIRTPMNAIIGFSELVNDPEIESDERQNYLDLIKSNGNVLLRIIDDIIDISRIESRSLYMNPEKCNVNENLKLVVDSARKSIARKQKSIKIELRLPADNQNPVLLTDIARFRQIFSNLIDNAEKFTESGSIVCGYTIDRVDDLEESINFYVWDTGIGIPTNKLDMIFDRFRQVDDSHNRLYGGTGLGLSITQKLVEAMKGKIRVESRVGEGSVFHVSLPYSPVKPTREEVPKEEPKTIGAVDWSKNLILVVEDVPSNYLFLEKLLKPTNAEIIWAQDGKVAIELFDLNSNIDLVLMDINLPEINGLDVTKYIRSKNKDVPVIAQTAFARESDKQDCLSAGCNDFITKPIKRKVFFEILSDYISEK